MMRRLAFLEDRRGAATVELALVAPILAGMAVLSFDAWEAGSSIQRASAGLDAAIGYYFNGGVTDQEAVSIATEAWANRPDDARVTATRVYRCDSAVSDDQACPEGAAPDVYINLAAEGSASGLVYGVDIHARRSVRVQ